MCNSSWHRHKGKFCSVYQVQVGVSFLCEGEREQQSRCSNARHFQFCHQHVVCPHIQSSIPVLVPLIIKMTGTALFQVHSPLLLQFLCHPVTQLCTELQESKISLFLKAMYPVIKMRILPKEVLFSSFFFFNLFLWSWQNDCFIVITFRYPDHFLKIQVNLEVKIPLKNKTENAICWDLLSRCFS